VSAQRGKLDRYRAKRDFEATPEPKGAVVPPEAQLPRFVIQQHSATRLHWDLRLEHDGVLASWALPKGLPLTPDENHLAVHTEDHPLEYLAFEGHIPDGSYGAGDMFVWDTGTYEAREFTDTKVVFTLHGTRARGQHALFSTARKGARDSRDWLIHRMDPPEDPNRRHAPADLRPMQATPGRAPRGERAWEVRWSGLRVLIDARPGEVAIRDARGEDVGRLFPEVNRIGRATGSTEVLLDGVVVAADDASLARRLAAKRAEEARRLARSNPVRVALFDAMWLDGYSLLAAPWHERRDALEDLRLDAESWFTPTAHVGDGTAIREAAAGRGVEALVAKRIDSRYRAGEASPDWREVALVS
jgi:bifunctional non-homologous end joining protein LigD